jgi:hypothetical protein
MAYVTVGQGKFRQHRAVLRGQGGPHAISWTHADQVNKALLDFHAG